MTAKDEEKNKQHPSRYDATTNQGKKERIETKKAGLTRKQARGRSSMQICLRLLHARGVFSLLTPARIAIKAGDETQERSERLADEEADEASERRKEVEDGAEGEGRVCVCCWIL